MTPTTLRDALFFQLDDDSDVFLRCPDCDGLVWLTKGRHGIETLGDVVKAVRAHDCGQDGA